MANLLVISDVHGCMDALDALTDRLDINRVDKILCLGDMVGYGPEPNEVIAQLRDWNAECVLGNHDAAVLGDKSVNLDDHFVGPTKDMLTLTQEIIDEDHVKWLESLPLVLHGTIDGIRYVASHSNPIEPTSWERIVDVARCQQLLTEIDAEIDLCFLGHSHQSGIVNEQPSSLNTLERRVVNRTAESRKTENRTVQRMVINPGYLFHAKTPYSMPSYFVFDTSSATSKLQHLEVDLRSTTEKLKRLGFSKTKTDVLIGFRPVV